ncbi:hypothetical protein [Cellulophaga fucicola]|uniref:Uncharacterized protein n=1 Tax=Cellulophaga fucicola TaxID=76595 RepID=A0A1K1R0I4_9FLAO|nr:hypothetical protein [Cellulophaga fucicola]SFW65687.1 hypothetical protein SAMN05660313_03164 [Cellulophaga fucicola]
MKKQLTQIILSLVFTAMFLSGKKEKVISDVKFEQVVFYEVSSLILDSIYYDKRLLPILTHKDKDFFKYIFL